MKNKKVTFIVTAALIAAIYTALTLALAPISYGAVQFRVSEALTIMAAMTPAAIPGLTVGCLLANLGSPYGLLDICCGTFATFLAALLSYYTRKITFKKLPVLSAIFPVITNAIIIGLEITIFLPEGFTFYAFLITALEVGAGELVVCYALGLPLFAAIRKIKLDKYLQ